MTLAGLAILSADSLKRKKDKNHKYISKMADQPIENVYFTLLGKQKHV